MKCIVNILIVSLLLLLLFESVDKIALKKYINSFLFPSNQLELIEVAKNGTPRKAKRKQRYFRGAVTLGGGGDTFGILLLRTVLNKIKKKTSTRSIWTANTFFPNQQILIGK